MNPDIMRGARLTTVDSSFRQLLLLQRIGVVDLRSEVIGISADGSSVADLEALGIRPIARPGATRTVEPIADAWAMVSLS